MPKRVCLLHLFCVFVFLGLASRGYAQTESSSIDAQPSLVVRRAPKIRPGYEPFAVVELYTSENCVRCKDVDEITHTVWEEFRSFKKRVFLLGFHVDYLNSVQWKDPYAKSEYSERQRAYTRAIGRRRVIPGEVVVNGKHFSSADAPEKVAETVELGLRDQVKVKIGLAPQYSPDHRSVNVKFTVEGIKHSGREFLDVHAVLVEDRLAVSVTDGLFAGKRFNHVNVVRGLETSRASSKETSGSINVVFPEDLNPAEASVICFVQDPEGMAILAAASFKISK